MRLAVQAVVSFFVVRKRKAPIGKSRTMKCTAMFLLAKFADGGASWGMLERPNRCWLMPKLATGAAAPNGAERIGGVWANESAPGEKKKKKRPATSHWRPIFQVS